MPLLGDILTGQPRGRIAGRYELGPFGVVLNYLCAEKFGIEAGESARVRAIDDDRFEASNHVSPVCPEVRSRHRPSDLAKHPLPGKTALSTLAPCANTHGEPL